MKTDTTTSPDEFFRPRNGDELLQAIADGKTCEVPNGWGMKALAFLESRLSNWSIFFDGSTNKGWSILRPTGDTPERFRRYLQERKEPTNIPENCNPKAKTPP